jgi:UDP-N-acetylmuramate dehydrogenase
MQIGLDLQAVNIEALREVFGGRLREQVSLGRYTAARIGGQADAFLEVVTRDELARAAELCWRKQLPMVILGGGSNILVSDAGVRGVVVLNRARNIHFEEEWEAPRVWAESGANLGLIARMAAQHGLSGLEWAAGIPGTVGGAVVGNAGAHGGDMAGSLIMAEILHRAEEEAAVESQRETWHVDRLKLGYRSSVLKQGHQKAVVLAATLKLERSTPQAVQTRLDELVAYRRRTQPPGASMGSMFKNPPGDHAGRLIEAAGLKGRRFGEAQISPLHANFFINLGQARATDVYELIQMARQTVIDRFGIDLELEIELLGEW